MEKTILKESQKFYLKISLVESRNDLAKESQKSKCIEKFEEESLEGVAEESLREVTWQHAGKVFNISLIDSKNDIWKIGSDCNGKVKRPKRVEESF